MMKVEQEELIEKTIAEIVTEDFKKAAVFKKYGIDFCCGGKKSLKSVCEKKRLNLNEIIEELAQVDTRTESEIDQYNKWRLDHLVEHIVSKHHTYVSEQIPIIKAFITKVSRVHGEAHPETKTIAILFEQVAQELEHHMMKEERILFPYIKSLAQGKNVEEMPFGSIQNPITMMEKEHEGAGLLFEKIGELTNNFTPPAYACNTFKASYHLLKEFENDLHVHIHLENNILFPKAIQLEHQILG